MLGITLGTSLNAQQWFYEQGQGIRSAGIKYGTTTLFINCVITAANVKNSLSVNFYRAGPEGILIFDFGRGTVLQVPFFGGSLTANTPANQNLFSQLIALMKTNNAVTISDPSVNARQTFSLQGASRAIGPCLIPDTSAPQQPQENLVLKLETYLAQLGFNPGPIDGIADANTNAAITAYQMSRKLPATGGMTIEEFRALETEATSPR